jgi:hypothetical protein
MSRELVGDKLACVLSTTASYVLTLLATLREENPHVIQEVSWTVLLLAVVIVFNIPTLTKVGTCHILLHERICIQHILLVM